MKHLTLSFSKDRISLFAWFWKRSVYSIRRRVAFWRRRLISMEHVSITTRTKAYPRGGIEPSLLCKRVTNSEIEVSFSFFDRFHWEKKPALTNEYLLFLLEWILTFEPWPKITWRWWIFNIHCHESNFNEALLVIFASKDSLERLFVS